jgi:predicted GH43/DUF377 family glycosyl hydrolase
MDVKRTGVVLKPNSARVLFRPFEQQDPQRSMRIVSRVMELSEAEVDALLAQVLNEFRGRHHRLMRFFLDRFASVQQYLLTDRALSENRKLLIGSYFTQEYSLESAALFNPSIVWHPDQGRLPAGARRFVISMRATGEGHISSLCFRGGVIDAQGQITIDTPTGFVTLPQVVPNAEYDKALFRRKLGEMGIDGGFVESALGKLEDIFTLDQLERSVQDTLRQHRPRHREWESVAKAIVVLAKANYEIQCDPEGDISERTIFPYSPTEQNGIEDARFVLFTDEQGNTRYYATYTAFDGSVVLPQMVEADDFLRFRISTLNGPEIRNKGMAFFPRKIDGHYAMLSRQDGENLYLMYSDMLNFWYTKQLVVKPTQPWEFVQVGNCGSPIETDAGWLVLSHGVGPIRKYSIGAYLLDRNDPARVIGRLSQPLLTPDVNEREGYVPNVVYSCGAVIHNGQLIIPYAMADYATTFATVPLEQVLDAMRSG